MDTIHTGWKTSQKVNWWEWGGTALQMRISLSILRSLEIDLFKRATKSNILIKLWENWLKHHVRFVWLIESDKQTPDKNGVLSQIITHNTKKSKIFSGVIGTYCAWTESYRMYCQGTHHLSIGKPLILGIGLYIKY